MGCDIHLVLERRRKDKPAAEWIGVYASDCLPGGRPLVARRDYDFFAEVASVRGRTSDYKNYPRNIPEDVSALAWQQYMHCPTDYHSASHMTAAEFVEVYQRVNPPKEDRKGHGIYDLLGVFADEDNYEFRVVFWFDN